MAMKDYNGVMLPEIPVVDGYPYAFIIKNTSADIIVYIVTYTKSVPYVNSFDSYETALFANDSTMYGYKYDAASNAWADGSETSIDNGYPVAVIGNISSITNELIWSNIDIPYGSPDSTEIYFKGEVKEVKKFYYNGVLLPEIPQTKQYSYIYKINYSGTIYYCCINSSARIYSEVNYGTVHLDFAESGETETYTYVEGTSSDWEFDSSKSVSVSKDDNMIALTESETMTVEFIYTNVDVPNGSADSTEIYLAASEPVLYVEPQYLVPESKLKALANSIRSKTGKTEDMDIDEMAVEIGGFSAGGSGGSEQNDPIYELIAGTLSTYSNDKITSLTQPVFSNQATLTDVSFPVCTTVGLYAFYNCQSLTNISFPACTTISGYAFTNCKKLTDVSFPVCTTISTYAFSSCSALKNISFPVCTNIGSNAFVNCSALNNINFPACTSIGVGAFSSCGSLTAVDFPACKSISSNAFYNCSSLTNVSFPICESISATAFASCKKLISANFQKCKYIGRSAFSKCSALTNVNFPECTNIDVGAFSYCTSLASISFPACTYVMNYAFYNCTSLTDVSLPACTSINANAFYNCTSLSRVTLEAPYVTIASSAFYRCNNLSELVLAGTSVYSLANSSVFLGTSLKTGNGYIYVPSSLITNYQTAYGWSYFSSKFSAIENMV